MAAQTVLLVLYDAIKRAAGIFFNVLNILLAGNLPPFTCVGIVVEDAGRYLLIEHPNGEFAFPSGFMRWNEQPEQTVVRECKEETGLDLAVDEVIGYYSLPRTRFYQMNTVSIIFKGKAVGGELRASIEGRPCWVHEDEFSTKKVRPVFTSILNDYKRSLTRSHPINISHV